MHRAASLCVMTSLDCVRDGPLAARLVKRHRNRGLTRLDDISSIESSLTATNVSCFVVNFLSLQTCIAAEDWTVVMHG